MGGRPAIALWVSSCVVLMACERSNPAEPAASASSQPPPAKPSAVPEPEPDPEPKREPEPRDAAASPHAAPVKLPANVTPVALCEARCRRFLACENESLTKRGSGSKTVAELMIQRCISACPRARASDGDEKLRECLAKPSCDDFRSCLGFPS